MPAGSVARVRPGGGRWSAEYERPANPDALMGKWQGLLDALRRSHMRHGEDLSEYARGQYATTEEVVADIAHMLEVKPCGICERGSRKACHHMNRVSRDELHAIRLLVRRGFRVGRTG